MCLSLAKMVPLAGLQDHTCTKTIHSIHQMCQALAKMVPLVRLQDHTCTKTIHSMHQMCLAMAKKNGTTGRAPRPHVYQDHTQYASDVSGYGKKWYHWQGFMMTHVPRPYTIYIRCVWLWQKIPLAGLQGDMCTKTIHNVCLMCLAMAKNTTDRAPRPQVYTIPYTIYVMCLAMAKNTTNRAPRPQVYTIPYTMYIRCFWLWQNIPLAGRAPRPQQA